MQQAPRVAIIGLLVLMQLFVPLVHAHRGGGQSPGAIHIPGLEFLAGSGGKFAQSSIGKGESQDAIVVPAPGLKNQGDYAIPAPDRDFILPALLSPAANLLGGTPFFSASCGGPFLQVSWLKPSPRAPPRLG